LRQQYGSAIDTHPLLRQITTTWLINEVVDGAGITYAFRLAEELNATATDAVRAFAVVTNVYGLAELWQSIAALDNVVPTDVADEMMLETRRVLDRASRWFLTNRPQPLAVGAEISRFGQPVRALAGELGKLVRGQEAERVRSEAGRLTEAGVPHDLAVRVSELLLSYALLDITEVAELADRDGDGSPVDVADLYFALSDHLGFDHMLSSVNELERDNRWHALARLALRDDLYGSLRAITLDALRHSDPGDAVEDKIAKWEQANASRLARARVTLDEISRSGRIDLATLSVAARQIRSTVR